MKTAFRSSFGHDLKKIEDRSMLDQIRQVIEGVETVSSLRAIYNLKNISGGGKYFRIRVSDDRIGIVVEGDEIEFFANLPTPISRGGSRMNRERQP